MERRALIVVTNHDNLGDTGQKTGYFLSEVTHVYYSLLAAGFGIDFASPYGGVAPLDESSRELDDPENAMFVRDKSLFERMDWTIAMADVDPARYGVIHFAGGHGAMWDFPNSTDIGRVSAAIYENGGVVAAVCHGPAALVNVTLSNGDYLVAGKEVAGFTNCEEDEVGRTAIVPFLLETKLIERGATFKAAKNWAENVVVSDRLVTGQNPQSATAVGREIVVGSMALR